MGRNQKQRIDWETGITAMGDIYVLFKSSDQHFKCTMDEDTAEEMGKALIEAAEKRKGAKEALMQ